MIPLLTEGGGRAHYPWLDRILVVDAPPALQKSRLMQRDGIDEALAERMIAAQATRAPVSYTHLDVYKRQLEIIGSGHKNPRMSKMIGAIRTDIEGGSSLHEAISKFPVQFDELYRNLVKAGEGARCV